MPTLSASDYTNYLKYKTAAVAYTSGNAPRAIQTVDQAAPTMNVINSIVKTSQAAYVVNPQQTGLNYVRAQQPERTNNPKNLSTVSWSSSSSITSTTSSKTQQPGGLPANNVVGTYYRIPQNAGAIQGNRFPVVLSASNLVQAVSKWYCRLHTDTTIEHSQGPT
jgi:hypothetical protein